MSSRLNTKRQKPSRGRRVGNAERPPDKPSVAVLPFVNMSGDREQDYFSDGMTEDIITDLSKVSELFVLSRNAVFRHKNSTLGIEQISRNLGVTYVLHGSVRKAGSKVRISAQLIQGASGGHIWAERYDRDLTDIFALQDDITKTIVHQLKVSLMPDERRAIEEAPTRSLDAYTYYLKGQRELFHRGSHAGYRSAKEMFARAIEIDRFSPGLMRASPTATPSSTWTTAKTLRQKCSRTAS